MTNGACSCRQSPVSHCVTCVCTELIEMACTIVRVVHPEHVASGLNKALPAEFVMMTSIGACKPIGLKIADNLSDEIDVMVTTAAVQAGILHGMFVLTTYSA